MGIQGSHRDYHGNSEASNGGGKARLEQPLFSARAGQRGPGLGEGWGPHCCPAGGSRPLLASHMPPHRVCEEPSLGSGSAGVWRAARGGGLVFSAHQRTGHGLDWAGLLPLGA